MSEQTPLKKSTGRDLQAIQAQQIQKAKQSTMVGLIKCILAIALVFAGVWAGDNVAGLPVYAKPIIWTVSAILALLVLGWGHFRNLWDYVRDSIREVKKVVWPERSYTLRMTVFVVIFVAIIAAFIWGVDTLISWLFFDLLLKRG